MPFSYCVNGCSFSFYVRRISPNECFIIYNSICEKRKVDLLTLQLDTMLTRVNVSQDSSTFNHDQQSPLHILGEVFTTVDMKG